MIGIEYLNKPEEIRLHSGTEMLEYQNKNFYNDLVAYFKKQLNENLQVVSMNFTKLPKIIRTHTNIDLSVFPMLLGGSSMVDGGFTSPGNVINNVNTDGKVDMRNSTVGKYFTKYKKDYLRGYCDLKTGKVEGGFKDLKFTIGLNPRIFEYVSWIESKKLNVSVPEVIASIVLHEVGHIFFGLYYICSTFVDNMLVSASIKMLINEPDKTKRITIVNDVNSYLETNVDTSVVKDELDETSLNVLFSKGLKDRDTRRALSIGVSEMSAETLADMYSIRMGGSKGMIAFLGSSQNQISLFLNRPILNSITAVCKKFTLTMLTWLMLDMIPPVGLALKLCFIYSNLQKLFGSAFGPLVSGEYNTPYRRMKAIVKENIDYLNTHKKSLSSLEYSQEIKKCVELSDYVERYKPIFEGTDFQRIFGWVMSGKDFRKNDFEHYTSELASTQLTLFKDSF